MLCSPVQSLNSFNLSFFMVTDIAHGAPTSTTETIMSPEVHSCGPRLKAASRASLNRLPTSADTRAQSTAATGALTPFDFDCASAIENRPASSGGTTSYSRSASV